MTQHSGYSCTIKGSRIRQPNGHVVLWPYTKQVNQEAFCQSVSLQEARLVQDIDVATTWRCQIQKEMFLLLCTVCVAYSS